MRRSWPQISLAVLLVVLIAGAFWPVRQNQFIKFDDREYLTANPHLQPNWHNIAWAFSTGYASNWHPLTWLSHMLDVQLFGLRPAGHHLMNLLFHAANAVLLFFLLHRLTGKLYRSAFVAALFGLHPLHVESVAWAAERKDVLSTLFFLLTLSAWARYAAALRADINGVALPARKPLGPNAQARSRLQCWIANCRDATFRPKQMYVLALGLFALGLLCKPMLVTLPFVLLLMDFWPLRRISLNWRTLWTREATRLVLEKVPFLCLAGCASAITFLVQKKSGAVVQGFPLSLRMANAVASYVKYLGQAIWPSHLAIFYPHPDTRLFSPPSPVGFPATEQWPQWQIIAAAIVLLLITVWVLLRVNRQPWLVMGWLWYLGTLVPVIGIVQVGSQAMADRYTYIPLIGVFICAVWSAAELFPSRRLGRIVLTVVGLAIIAACCELTRRQVSYWRNTYTLFSHALQVTSPNGVAHYWVGMELLDQDKTGLAETHFRQAVLASPLYQPGYCGLAYVLELHSKPELAVLLYEKALAIQPDDEPTRLRLAGLLRKSGDLAEAAAQYEQTLRRNPEQAEAHYELGLILDQQNRSPAALAHFEAAVRLRPENDDARARAADIHFKLGQFAEAEPGFRELVRRHPADVELRLNLGGTLYKLGRVDPAQAEYAAAVRLSPANPAARFNFGLALLGQRKLAEAGEQFAQAVRLKPDYTDAFIELGRALVGQGQIAAAQTNFAEAVRLCPTNASLRINLGSALLMTGQTNAASKCFAEALNLDPNLANRYLQEGKSLAARANLAAALARFRTSLWLRPDDPDALANTAWILATAPQSQLRNGPEALQLAQQALELDRAQLVSCRASLDVAYGECGRFKEAISAAQQTKALALSQGDRLAAQAADSRLELYLKNLPYHQ